MRVVNGRVYVISGHSRVASSGPLVAGRLQAMGTVDSKVQLTGVKPTGEPHPGNALTSARDPEQVRKAVGVRCPVTASTGHVLAEQARDSLRRLTADLAEGTAAHERPKDVVRTVAALRALVEQLPKLLLLASAEIGDLALDPEATAAVRQLTEAAVGATELAIQLQEAHQLVARTRPRPRPGPR
jgi:hypothetical protein